MSFSVFKETIEENEEKQFGFRSHFQVDTTILSSLACAREYIKSSGLIRKSQMYTHYVRIYVYPCILQTAMFSILHCL